MKKMQVQSSYTRPKSKVKLSQIIPVFIIVASFAGALYFSGFFDSFTSDQSPTDFTNNIISDGGKLTPTRDIEGTWKTTFSTQFTIATDYENFGHLTNVGTEDRIMTWTITGTSDEHVVLVNVQFDYSNRQLASASGYTPDTSFMQLTGIINGTQLTLTKGNAGPIEQIGTVGEFTFTSTQMEGTWHDHWTGVWEQNVYTSTNGLKLTKQ
jgi:hypothetical protein